MPKQPTTCACPKCKASIPLEHLKANLPDEVVKSLWASLGARNRTGRKISAKQQAAMQAARKAARAAKEGVASE